MKRLTVVLLAAACASWAQDQPDKPLAEAGECGRCHVISVVEWGYSGHRAAGTGCVECHGESRGHVLDERNNIKPDRVPQGAAMDGLCATCHDSGCPRSKRKEGCATCHHYHALVDVRKSASLKDERLDRLIAGWKRYEERMAEGERHASARDWRAARSAYRAALAEKPGDGTAASKLAMCTRRLKPELPGFELAAPDIDEATGLPLRVRVRELGIEMVLVNGGDAELGSERFRGSKPVHSVAIAPFYLAARETTQAEWKAVMQSNPSRYQGKEYADAGRMPVESVSWNDVAAFLAKLNAKVEGGGFRLPTEAEWEFAALPGGEAGEAFDLTAPRPGGGGTPNRFGLFDLQGNVREWCSSLAAAYPYNAFDGRESAGGSGLRILRGGAFAEPESWFHPSLRHSERPERRLPWNGFRLARSVPPPPDVP